MENDMDNNIKYIEGGVTAARGFTAGAVLCKIKPNRKTYDVALVKSEKECNLAAMFTHNRVKAESVKLCMQRLLNHKAMAVIANSGNANACTGDEGKANAYKMARMVANALNIEENDVLVCSTGVIGQQLNVGLIESKIEELASSLDNISGHEKAARAIMTTDTQLKECAVETTIAGKVIRIGAMCKGSGMIHINMGTMLCFITTDCAINANLLDEAMRECVDASFNCVSIDGDTSTNDTLLLLANGCAGNKEIENKDKDYDDFVKALMALCTVMAKKIAADGEGASRLIECVVKGAVDLSTARKLSRAVVCSNLVKAAFFGKDANWGRVLCAMGYSKQYFDIDKVTVQFVSCKGNRRFFTAEEASSISGIREGNIIKDAMSITVFKNGVPQNFDEVKAKEVLDCEVVGVLITLGDGDKMATAWGCDLTYDYVKINGDYRT